MISTEFLHDCSQCAALCCMATVINKSERFAFDKPAATACQNLGPAGHCKIHEDLEDKGCSGCVDFTCLGAGQRVTQDLFDGQSWQDDPKLQEPMTRAFLDLYRVQEARWLLQTAGFMGIPEEKEEERRQMLAIYGPGDAPWTRARLDAALGALSPDVVRRWLRGLAELPGLSAVLGAVESPE